MKVLKILLYVLITIVVIACILMFVAPTAVKIERSILINAPKEVVFKNVKFLEKRHQWSPWKDPDPDLKWSIEGTDGEVGAIYRWEGNKEVGKGSQEITRIEDLKRIEDKLTFIEHQSGEANGYFDLSDSAGMVKVLWGFTTEAPRPMNIFHLFFDMDKMIGGTFEIGLGRLKEMSEKEATGGTQSSYNVQEIQWDGKTYFGKKETVDIENIGKVFEANIPELFKVVETEKISMAGSLSGLYFVWDEAGKKTEMAVTVPVTELKKDIKGYEKFEIKPGKALHIVYYGSYEKSEQAHYAMDNYIKEKSLKFIAPVIEEYVVGPSSEKDTSKWLTNIYYLVE
jgi:effector-binding domain-containing protein